MLIPQIAQILKKEPGDEIIDVYGWVRTRRDSGAISFFEINDGSSQQNLQVVVDRGETDSTTEIKTVGTGSSVHIRGRLVESPARGQDVELQASRFELIGGADPDSYPLQKKRHSFEFLRTIPHLRPRTNALSAVARIRSCLNFAIHGFFRERGFFQVHTPIITTSDCEGAGEMFTVTSLPPEKFCGRDAFQHDFFGRRAGLTVSGQLQAEIYAQTLGRVYTFGPTFRAENSNTSRHLAEFWMLEPEMSFCDLQCDMDVAEELIRELVLAVLEQCSPELDLFNSFIDKGLGLRLEKTVHDSFVRVPYSDAIDMLLKAGKTFEYPVRWGMDMQSEHERFLCEEVIGRPVIVYDYPENIKPFYMRLNDDGRTVAAMDILMPGIGELVGGSQREERYDYLVKRMDDAGLSREEYSWYLDLRRFGTVPHAGFGLGFDRLIQFVTGMHNIRDVIPFPRTPGSAPC
ncbi:MAG: asparagine--tRNA ligase [Desulfobulbaceae bacterium]|nr:asparagine--tRNA ligase [Desulfobulbaceae bacterium]